MRQLSCRSIFYREWSSTIAVVGGDEAARLDAALDRLEAEPKLDHVRYLYLLKRCGAIKAVELGRRIQASLAHLGGYDRDRYFGNVLIKMFGSCGSVEEAKQVFDGIKRKNIYTWNMLLAAYAQNGQIVRARTTFEQMERKDAVSFDTMISAYAGSGDVDRAKEIFDSMPGRGLLSWNTLLKAIAHNRDRAWAMEFFHRIPQQDVVSWNTMMAAFLRELDDQGAKKVFDRVPQRSVVTWSAMIAAYAQRGSVDAARAVFDRLPRRSIVCWTSMITALARGGRVDDARKLFDVMPDRDDMAWSTMVAAYTQHDRKESAKSLLAILPETSKRPWAVMIASLARGGDPREAVELFSQMPRPDLVSWTAVLGAIVQPGDLRRARELFDRFEKRDVVAWTAVIAAHLQYGRVREAIELFGSMDLEGMAPDKITFVSILDACVDRGCVAQGRMVHDAIAGSEFEKDAAVGTALFNLYARSAKVGEARAVFDGLQELDVVAWTAMIAAYAQNGHTLEACELFKDMILVGAPPNEVTLIAILAACSHAGWLERGYQHFLSITGDFGGILDRPSCEHYVCMVDLLGRSGRVEEAEELIRTMPFEPNEVAWMILLGACKLHKDSRRAARVAEECDRLNIHDHKERDFSFASRVLLSNILGEAGPKRWHMLT